MIDYLVNLDNWVKISSVISAFWMGVITYYVYKLSSLNSKKDTYFRNIAKIVDEIETYYYAMKKEKDEEKKKLFQRKIVTRCSIAIFYIKRFPGYNVKRLDLICTFLYISQNISKNLDDRYFDILPYLFNDFCMEIKKNKTSSKQTSFDTSSPGAIIESF